MLLCGVLFPFIIDSGYAAGAAPATHRSNSDTARFQISFHRGLLTLDGHIVSDEHGQQLLHAADAFFSDVKTSSEFRLLDRKPDQWESTTRSILEALSATYSAEAILTSSALKIRGVAASDWHERVESLRLAVSNTTTLDVDVVVPDPQISARELCGRAIDTHQEGQVYFEESATTFRSSAIGVLERAISLADACPDSTIVITGHTDSSGYEPSNQQLSVTRAMQVADYISNRGISRGQLAVVGVGSSQPVADNATRFGRSLNRRISIELRQPDPTETD